MHCIGVVILNEHSDLVNSNPEQFISACFHQVWVKHMSEIFQVRILILHGYYNIEVNSMIYFAFFCFVSVLCSSISLTMHSITINRKQFLNIPAVCPKHLWGHSYLEEATKMCVLNRISSTVILIRNICWK
jgi:hypothetical protein